MYKYIILSLVFLYIVDSDGRAACKVEAGCSGSSNVCTCMLSVLKWLIDCPLFSVSTRSSLGFFIANWTGCPFDAAFSTLDSDLFCS